MMVLEHSKTRGKVSNNVVLETEKDKDSAEKEVHELTRQIQPKRSHTHDDGGDFHDMITEVDNWDLSVHRRETTHVQNRRNVSLGSLHDQPRQTRGTCVSDEGRDRESVDSEAISLLSYT